MVTTEKKCHEGESTPESTFCEGDAVVQAREAPVVGIAVIGLGVQDVESSVKEPHGIIWASYRLASSSRVANSHSVSWGLRMWLVQPIK